MTTAAMVLGVVPLLAACGTGAASRFTLGPAITTGRSIGPIFTLVAVTAFYTLIAAERRPAMPSSGTGRAVAPAE